jgi:hypothetical protein
MEQGPTEKSIIEQCIRQRRPLPNAIANAPSIEIGLDIFFVAFMDLTTCRTMGFGEGPIPWTAKRIYAVDELSLEGEQKEDFYFYLAEMDRVYLAQRAEEMKKKQ